VDYEKDLGVVVSKYLKVVWQCQVAPVYTYVSPSQELAV